MKLIYIINYYYIYLMTNNDIYEDYYTYKGPHMDIVKGVNWGCGNNEYNNLPADFYGNLTYEQLYRIYPNIRLFIVSTEKHKIFKTGLNNNVKLSFLFDKDINCLISDETDHNLDWITCKECLVTYVDGKKTIQCRKNNFGHDSTDLTPENIYIREITLIDQEDLIIYFDNTGTMLKRFEFNKCLLSEKEIYKGLFHFREETEENCLRLFKLYCNYDDFRYVTNQTYDIVFRSLFNDNNLVLFLNKKFYNFGLEVFKHYGNLQIIANWNEDSDAFYSKQELMFKTYKQVIDINASYDEQQYYELCYDAVTTNKYALGCVMPELLGCKYYKICMLAFQNRNILNHHPMKTYNIINFVNQDYLTIDEYFNVCIESAKSDGYSFDFMNHNSFDFEQYVAILKKAVKSQPKILSTVKFTKEFYLSEHYYQLALIAVKSDCYQISELIFIGDSIIYQNYESLCMMAVSSKHVNSSGILKIIDIKYHTFELYKKLVETNKYTEIKHFNKDILSTFTPEQRSYLYDKFYVGLYDVKYVPFEEQTVSMCEKLKKYGYFDWSIIEKHIREDLKYLFDDIKNEPVKQLDGWGIGIYTCVAQTDDYDSEPKSIW